MTTQTANQLNKSDLSDKYTRHKEQRFDLNNNNNSDPLTLFRNLSLKCINPKNPTNTPTDTPAPLPPPATEPTFTPAQVRFFGDFYCSRPRDERLAMHRRSLYLRADRGWPWDICETQAQREAYEAAGRPDNFTMATDGLNDRMQRQKKEASK